MSLILIGFVALLLVLVLIGVPSKWKSTPVNGGLFGLFVGLLVGVIATVVIGASHFFGPVEIPNPVLQIGGAATTFANVMPIIFGALRHSCGRPNSCTQ